MIREDSDPSDLVENNLNYEQLQALISHRLQKIESEWEFPEGVPTISQLLRAHGDFPSVGAVRGKDAHCGRSERMNVEEADSQESPVLYAAGNGAVAARLAANREVGEDPPRRATIGDSAGGDAVGDMQNAGAVGSSESDEMYAARNGTDEGRLQAMRRRSAPARSTTRAAIAGGDTLVLTRNVRSPPSSHEKASWHRVARPMSAFDKRRQENALFTMQSDLETDSVQWHSILNPASPTSMSAGSASTREPSFDSKTSSPPQSAQTGRLSVHRARQFRRLGNACGEGDSEVPSVQCDGDSFPTERKRPSSTLAGASVCSNVLGNDFTAARADWDTRSDKSDRSTSSANMLLAKESSALVREMAMDDVICCGSQAFLAPAGHEAGFDDESGCPVSVPDKLVASIGSEKDVSYKNFRAFHVLSDSQNEAFGIYSRPQDTSDGRGQPPSHQNGGLCETQTPDRIENPGRNRRRLDGSGSEFDMPRTRGIWSLHCARATEEAGLCDFRDQYDVGHDFLTPSPRPRASGRGWRGVDRGASCGASEQFSPVSTGSSSTSWSKALAARDAVVKEASVTFFDQQNSPVNDYLTVVSKQTLQPAGFRKGGPKRAHLWGCAEGLSTQYSCRAEYWWQASGTRPSESRAASSLLGSQRVWDDATAKRPPLCSCEGSCLCQHWPSGRPPRVAELPGLRGATGGESESLGLSIAPPQPPSAGSPAWMRRPRIA